MGYGYGGLGYGMMGGYGGVLSSLTFFVFLVVGVLAAIWLWQHIDKK
jgi:hypothetical protein